LHGQCVARVAARRCNRSSGGRGGRRGAGYVRLHGKRGRKVPSLACAVCLCAQSQQSIRRCCRGTADEMRAQTDALGKELARRGIELVFGGGA
jgi:hypothetical protein